jgi:hypothetical protein
MPSGMRRAGTMLAAMLVVWSWPGGGMAEEVVLRAHRPGGRPPVEIRASASEAAWVIRVLDRIGGERQRFEVESDLPDSPPRLGDADGDGAADLWVPVMAGNANTAYAIWIMRPALGRFHAAGEVSGIAFARDPGGWLVALGRDGCCAVAYGFHRFSADGTLSLAFTVERRTAPHATRRCGVEPAVAIVPRDLLRRYCARGRDDAPLPGTRALP